ncbi:DUF6906 family protein [Paenibacillus piscarius]|uniref:DUF6906 family protein n=1 Tax=Paenibacillus piscarius TaxID=1089681 RepID=UPI001EE99AA7|nr:hypothetical protein [Paenibacillus piscarius]
MKKTKRPTRRQKEVIQANKLNPRNWLVERISPKGIVIVHRDSGKSRFLGLAR